MIKTLLLWLLEATAEEIYCKVGTKAEVSGIYKCKSQYIPIAKGETFPPTGFVSLSFWKLVVSVS